MQRALTAVTDSPAYLDGRFTGTAGFHGIDLAAHCDQLTAALCHAAEVGAARVHRLLDSAVTGLPAQLAREPGTQAGLTPVHKRAAGDSLPPMRRTPLVMSSSPAIIRSAVVLPQPDGPTRTMNSPSATSTVRSLTA